MNNNKYILLLILSLLIFTFTITGCSTKEKTTEKTKINFNSLIDDVEDETSSILTDKKFKRGFVVRGLGIPIYKDHAEEETYGPAYETGYLFQYGKEDLDKPVWEIDQWSTRYAFHDESITTFKANGTEYTYTNPSKFFRVNTSTGEFVLGLEGEKCYVYGDREPYMEWPHLLIARDINRSFLTKVSDKTEVNILLNATLERYEDKMRIEPHPHMHAAQCMFYLFISNYDEATDNFTDMLWLGMTIFDNRCEYTEEFARQDNNSKESQTYKFIYNVANSEYLAENNNFYRNGEIKVGTSVSINFNILPYIKIAFEKAQEDGCMLGSKYENLYINGMYIGFELPGTYNLEMSFRDMDVRVK